MPEPTPVKAKRPPRTKPKPPESTLEEVKYLKHLIEKRVPVVVKLSNDEEVHGNVEYYDAAFIRLTRTDGPNLFIYKHDIKYLYEVED